MNYKSTFGYHRSSTNGIEFPFFLEIAVIQSDDVHDNLQYMEGLNSTVFPNQYSFLIGDNEDTFQWETASDRQKKDSHHKARSIFDILSYYGYSYDREECKKPRSLVITNLISPRIDYKSYGKSGIDLTPFADVIGQTTAKVCSSGGSVPSVYRIGIDFETLDYLGIDPRVVEETYNPKQNRIKPLEDWANTKKDRLLSEVEYVHHKRVVATSPVMHSYLQMILFPQSD
jgi:hypothetical protein